jgi:hypothetical protein
VPKRNRVDPFGDLHAVSARGMFTGNRGCLVDEEGRLARHHRGQLWIICVTTYRDWLSPLDQPGHWTPLFFLDEAVGLAAGHRPCGLCRRDAHASYRAAVTRGLGRDRPVPAVELNRMLAAERLQRGRGLVRAGDRKLWSADIGDLPRGAVVVESNRPSLVTDQHLFVFDFAGWRDPRPRPESGQVRVLTPPTTVLALHNGFVPVLHSSIGDG